MFFTTAADSKGVKESVKRALVAAPEVLWVGEFGGEFQYALGFAALRFSTLIDFLRGISKRFPKTFFDKTLAVRISSTIFPRKYLCANRFKVESITALSAQEDVSIDDLDGKVLGGLTSFGALSHRQLARKLQIPLSTLELRIHKLKERGVIAGEIYIVEPALFGYQSYKLLVYTKGLDPTFTSLLHGFCSYHPNITYLVDLLGAWGYEIGCEVRGAEEVTAIIQQIYDGFGHLINSVKVLTKFAYPKNRWFPETVI